MVYRLKEILDDVHYGIQVIRTGRVTTMGRSAARVKSSFEDLPILESDEPIALKRFKLRAKSANVTDLFDEKHIESGSSTHQCESSAAQVESRIDLVQESCEFFR